MIIYLIQLYFDTNHLMRVNLSQTAIIRNTSAHTHLLTHIYRHELRRLKQIHVHTLTDTHISVKWQLRMNQKKCTKMKYFLLDMAIVNKVKLDFIAFFIYFFWQKIGKFIKAKKKQESKVC